MNVQGRTHLSCLLLQLVQFVLQLLLHSCCCFLCSLPSGRDSLRLCHRQHKSQGACHNARHGQSKAKADITQDMTWHGMTCLCMEQCTSPSLHAAYIQPTYHTSRGKASNLIAFLLSCKSWQVQPPSCLYWHRVCRLAST
jgi:hypothetical protein